MAFPTPGVQNNKAAGLFLLLVFACAMPVLLTDFQLFKLTNVVIYAIALLGINIVTGYNGQISLGHGAFYTLGAYTAAILMVFFPVPHWAALPVAGVVCLVAGVLFALPLARLAPMHLAMATFALAGVTPELANYKGIANWTGGSQGLGIDRPAVPFGLPLSYDQWIFLLALGVLLLSFVTASNLLRGRIGRAIVAVRDHPLGAQAMGVHATFYKTLTFGISTMYTGVAGALSAMVLLYAAPAGIFVSLGFLIGAAVGGIATLSGAIYGAIFLQLILLVAGSVAQSVKTPAVLAIYGIVVILCLHLMPTGVAGLVQRLLSRRK
jgi:branched-chain amino acid transport system permease protein